MRSIVGTLFPGIVDACQGPVTCADGGHRDRPLPMATAVWLVRTQDRDMPGGFDPELDTDGLFWMAAIVERLAPGWLDTQAAKDGPSPFVFFSVRGFHEDWSPYPAERLTLWVDPLDAGRVDIEEGWTSWGMSSSLVGWNAGYLRYSPRENLSYVMGHKRCQHALSTTRRSTRIRPLQRPSCEGGPPDQHAGVCASVDDHTSDQYALEGQTCAHVADASARAA